MNNENLDKGKNTRFKSGEEATRKAGHNGGIKSGISKRETKKIAEYLALGLSQIIKNSKGEEKTAKEAMVLKLIQSGLQGNLKAIEYIIKLLGEDPATKLELTGDSLIQKVFVTETDKKEINKKIDELINE